MLNISVYNTSSQYISYLPLGFSFKFVFAIQVKNNVDPDQLASSEAS